MTDDTSTTDTEPTLKKGPWKAWGYCPYPECLAAGDMEWYEDSDGSKWAVCFSCDREITAAEMPNSADEQRKAANGNETNVAKREKSRGDTGQ